MPAREESMWHDSTPRLVGTSRSRKAETLVASLLGSLIALANRRYELAPTPERVASLAGADEDRLRWMFIGNLLEAVELNRAKLRVKSRWLTASQAALLVTVIQLGAYSVWREVRG
jgi:hypothetical protein